MGCGSPLPYSASEEEAEYSVINSALTSRRHADPRGSPEALLPRLARKGGKGGGALLFSLA